MHATTLGERTLTDLDHARLTRLLNVQPAPLADYLEGARVTSTRKVPPDTVTMNSRVEVAHAGTHRRQVLTLCYPQEAAPAAGAISVLSPVGSSLLGLRIGDEATWLTPDGTACSARITAIEYQPEASGDYAR